MDFEQPTPTTENKQENMEPKEVLRYMAKLGEDIARNAREVEAMMEEAKKRGIDIDISGKIKDLEPLKEVEIQLVNIRAKIGELKGDMFTQGLKMTAEEMKTRLDKMEK